MTNPVLTAAIDSVASHVSLPADQAAAVLAEIMRGDASEVEIAALLIGLRAKGETADELAGFAKTMRSFATAVRPAAGELLDTAGTGGGRATFNVSTTAAVIAAAAGCTVAKHGNRSATGLSGSADVLEALGVRIDLDPAAIARCIDEVGFGFMFAPNHHAATRFVVPVRKELAVRTIFNLLGPLTNPAAARRQVVGVADRSQVEVVAGALALLGVRRALVVSSDDGLDEMSISAATQVVEVSEEPEPGRGPTITRYAVTPEEVGLSAAPADAVPAGDPVRNAAITQAIFAGEQGPARDLAALNAGAAIYAGGGAASIADGVEKALAAIDDGSAAQMLERIRTRTQELAPR